MQYALIVFVTDYATSFLHVMHFLTVSMQNEMRWYVTLPEVLIFLFLNPIAPAINCALWMIFRILEKEKMIKHYTFLSKLTCLINGTFESPVQIILTLFFYTTGRIAPPWRDTTEFFDSLGNRINLGSYISVVSFTLCWISLLKNVSDSYLCAGLNDILSVIAFVLPNVLFRIFSYTTLLLLVREWTVVPITIIFVINLFIGGRMMPEQKGINLSSTSFCSIFCVVGMPADPSVLDATKAKVETGTLKNLTLLITIVGLPVIGAFCWLAFEVLPQHTGMKQDRLNIQLTEEQELFLMTNSYSGLIGLSLLSCLIFWVFFNNPKVPDWTRACLNVVTILATVSGIVLTVTYFPPSPTSVILTAENEHGGVEIFEGLINNSANIADNDCKVRRDIEGATLLMCNNFTTRIEFASTRKAQATKSHKLIVLDPNAEESNLFEAFDKKKIRIIRNLGGNLQRQLQKAHCLKCHHQESNVCKNIIVESGKGHCMSTCTRIPKTRKPISSEYLDDLDTLLVTDPSNMTVDERWYWKENTVHYHAVSQVKVLCQAPRYFFEADRRTECKSPESSVECRLTQLQCVGNDKWGIKERPQCRSCTNDTECFNIGKGNKCRQGTCVKELLLIGLSRENVTSHQDLVLLDPVSLKTSSCKIPRIPHQKVQAISQIGNALYSFRIDGLPSRLDSSKWTTLRGMSTPRSEYAALTLNDGRQFVTGGKATTDVFKTLDSSEFLLAKMGRGTHN